MTVRIGLATPALYGRRLPAILAALDAGVKKLAPEPRADAKLVDTGFFGRSGTTGLARHVSAWSVHRSRPLHRSLRVWRPGGGFLPLGVQAEQQNRRGLTSGQAEKYRT